MTRNATSRSLGRLIGGPVRAVDGELGVIKDFYFDDEQWTVRYMVVDIGTWLPGRQVLVPLWALEAAEWDQTRVPTRLTRQQVKDGPDVDTRQPISRREEARSLAYYGYPYYWPGPALWGPVATPGVAWTPPPDAAAGATSRPLSTSAEEEGDEEHLRSWREVKGYHLRAADGEIGHIDDLVANRQTWRIEQLLVDTSNWIGGRTALVPVESVQRISWLDHIVEIALTRDEVIASGAHHVG